MLTVIVVGAGAYEYYQIQQEELIQFLNHYRAYNSDFKYEQLAVVDVDTLSKLSGNLAFKSLIITYTFNPPDEYDDVPYLRLTYASGPACNISQYPSSVNCHEMLLIIPTNNVTVMDKALSAGPLNNFGFDLYTETGAHIEWQLYLFLATYVGTGNGGLQA
jgi:hypothetical protein